MRTTAVLCLLAALTGNLSAEPSEPRVNAEAVEAQETVPRQPEGVFLPQRSGPAGTPYPDPWRLRALAGSLVYDETRDSREVLARFVRFTDEALVVTVGGRHREMAVADVERISLEGDSLKNGALLGLAIGPVYGLLAPCDTCRNIGERILGGTAVAAGTGVLVDYLHKGRTTVFPPR